MIREVEPQKPSTKIRSSMTQPSGTSTTHRTETSRLAVLVRGDLDWITMKALAKERNDRYQTASDLAEDIGRHLENRPIEARRPSMVTRFSKFVRRHRTAAAFATVAVATVIAAGFLGAQALWAQLENRELRIAKVAQEAETRLAQQEKQRADEQRDLAEQQEYVTRLVDHSTNVRDAHPTLATLLALEAIDFSCQHEDLLLPKAHEALLNVVPKWGGRAIGTSGQQLTHVEMSKDWIIGYSRPDDLLSFWPIVDKVDVPADQVGLGIDADLDDEDLKHSQIEPMTLSGNGRRLATCGDRLADLGFGRTR